MQTTKLQPNDEFIKPEMNDGLTNASATQNAYTYTPLVQTPLQIRLVHIHPGPWEAPISCDLHTVLLDKDITKYQTLSYVWGPPSPTTTILVDGHRFKVGENLGKALKRLRKPNGCGERIIWIDALCINQSDAEEKGQQVQLMGDIYEGCEEVVMWLGEAENNIPTSKSQFRSIEDQRPRPWDGFLNGDFEFNRLNNFEEEIKEDEMLAAFTLVYILSGNKHIRDWPFLVHNPDKDAWEITETFKNAIKGMEKLVSLAYWTRIWIMQEAILPPRATVVYGSFAAPWNMFAQSSKLYEFHGGSQMCCRNDFMKMDAYAFDLIVTKLYFVVSPIVRFRQYRNEGTSGNQSLFSLLQAFFLAKATDDRDKVYALLSLLNPGFEWPGSQACRPKPDYTTTTMQSYEHAATYIIKSTQNLTMLSYAHLYHCNTPSWVADWGTPPDTKIWKNRWEWGYPLSKYQCFDAAKGTLCGAVDLGSSRLLLWGLHFDTVVTIGELRLSGQNNTVGLTCEELLALARLENDPNQDYVGGGTWKSTSWRTICQDCNVDDRSNWRRTNASDAEKFESWHKVAKSNSWIAMGDAAQEFFSTATSTINVRPFVTGRGYLGMGPANIKSGDEVFVVKGSNVPLVLKTSNNPGMRVVIDGDDQTIPLYQFVGGCFVHGIMDGEYFEKEEAKVKPFILS